ncbi:hypothetical protein [Nitrosovibrio sp. Nv6]|uniref:hypothetical protein n=1 Tax=Nitrosovibrio sp. Nv6 TaxID=1855340 RepID=UPI0008AD5BA7|nr:hypothetical protein [Nitrosovibrio sp. Nv6]SEO65358.1 hypothetical protein SAMN05216316_0717 [Nitrosovibrio sp. Nv6]
MTQHAQPEIGIVGLLVVLVVAGLTGLVSWMSHRDHDQRREIAHLSTTCADSQAGEKLASTTLSHTPHGTWELRCTYSPDSGYGRTSRVRLAPRKTS